MAERENIILKLMPNKEKLKIIVKMGEYEGDSEFDVMAHKKINLFNI